MYGTPEIVFKKLRDTGWILQFKKWALAVTPSDIT